MNNTASITALLSAFGRAFHADQEINPIFADTKARELMTEEEYAAIKAYILNGMDFFAPEKAETFSNDEDALRYLVYTQIAPTPLARARFCEDSLKTAMQTGTSQYVILGAGMDTFAFRESDLLKTCRVFEVDHPYTQADKLQRIQRAGWKIPDHLTYVSVNFSTDDLKSRLLQAGFDPTRKTLFSWLGVSYYLSNDAITAMLHDISCLSAEGSSLVFDYADEQLFCSQIKRVQNMLAMAAAGGEPMQSCFDVHALQKLLETEHFFVYEWMSPRDIQAKYFAGRGENLTAFEHIRYVTAVYKP